MNKIFLILLLALGIMSSISAQNAYLNESKYWFYRFRLLTEFIVNGESSCGIANGLSIPCGSAYLPPNTVLDELGKPFDVQQHFGDGTSFLGYYIGVLATEHKLLQNNNASQWQKDKVKEELYFAMKAFERLDKNAETLFASVKLDRDCIENTNGFFMRDDVPASAKDPTLARNLNNGFRYRDKDGNKLNREITSDYGDQKNATIEELSGNSGDDKVKHPFNSLDQCVDLMVGFSLVTKLMDNESWNGYNFKYYARESTNIILYYLKVNDYFIPIPGQGDKLVKYGGIETRASAYPLAQAGNMIYNDKLGAYKQLSLNPSVPTTYNNVITALTKPLWTILDYPSGKTVFEKNRVVLSGPKGSNIPPKLEGTDYNNALTTTLAAIGNSWETGFAPNKVFDESLTIPLAGVCTWRDCKNIFGVEVCSFPVLYPCDLYLGRVQVYCYNTPSFMNSSLFYQLLESAGFSFKIPDALKTILNASTVISGNLCVPIVNPTGSELIPRITYNTTGYALSKYADLYDLQLFPLLHRVLQNNQGDYDYDQSKMIDILNTAPCNGPHYKPYKDPHVNPHGEGDEGVFGWRNDNRFEKTIDATMREAGSSSLPGLDYMLFYNLYSLVYGNWDTRSGYNNQMNMNIYNKTYPYNFNGNSVGSDIFQKREVAYDYLYVNNAVVNSGQANTAKNGNVVFKAGERIKIEKISIKSGANFKAYIEKSTPCSEFNTQRVVYEPKDTQEVVVLPAKKVMTDEEFEQHVKTMLEKEVKRYKDSIVQENKKEYQSVESYLASKPKALSSDYFNVTVFPNPFISSITVSSIFSNIDKVEVYDAIGNKLSGQGANESKVITLATENFTTGLYYVKIYSGNHLEVKKVIKSK